MPVAKLQNANCVLRSNCAERVNSRRVLTNKWADYRYTYMYSTPHYGTGTARYSCTCTRTNTTTVARSLSTKYLVPVLSVLVPGTRTVRVLYCIHERSREIQYIRRQGMLKSCQNAAFRGNHARMPIGNSGIISTSQAPSECRSLRRNQIVLGSRTPDGT